MTVLKPELTVEKYDGPPVEAFTYAGAARLKLGVELPERHTHPRVREAGHEFGRVLAAARAARAGLDEAEAAALATENGLAVEFGRQILADGSEGDPLTPGQAAEHLEDAQRQVKVWRTIAAGAQGAIPEAHNRLLAVVAEVTPEWTRYLAVHTGRVLERVEAARRELLDAVTEAVQLEGWRLTLANGGVKTPGRKDMTVGPSRSLAEFHVHELRTAVETGVESVKAALSKVEKETSRTADFSAWVPSESGSF